MALVERPVADAELREVDGSGGPLEAADEAVAHRLRLLVDLLEHEVAVAALLGGHRIPGDLLGLGGHLVAGEVGQPHAAGRDGGDLAVVQENHLPGVGEDRGDVGGHELAALAEPDHQRWPLAGGDDLLRVVGRDHGDRVDAFDLADRAPHGRLEVAVEVLGDQVDDRLGIGLGDERMAGGGELLAQRQEVLDDAVVDDDDLAACVPVRVGVLLARRPVGGPARVADAERAFQRLVAEHRLEVGELAGGAAHLELAVDVDHRDAGGVVAAILEQLEPVEKDRSRRLVADVADDSAHQLESSPRGVSPASSSGAAWRAAQASLLTWRPRPRPRAPSGTSSVIVEPAPT
jgi:hypothetical protein